MEVTLGNDEVARVNISEDIIDDSFSKPEMKHNFEINRKPVQVNVDNLELTISPSNKLKMSETLIKRLSDSNFAGDSNIDKVKKRIEIESPPISSISSNKSQTDILVKKFKSVVEESKLKVHNLTENNESFINKSKYSSYNLKMNIVT